MRVAVCSPNSSLRAVPARRRVVCWPSALGRRISAVSPPALSTFPQLLLPERPLLHGVTPTNFFPLPVRQRNQIPRGLAEVPKMGALHPRVPCRLSPALHFIRVSRVRTHSSANASSWDARSGNGMGHPPPVLCADAVAPVQPSPGQPNRARCRSSTPSHGQSAPARPPPCPLGS